MKMRSFLVGVLAAATTIPAAQAAMPPANAWEIGPWVRGRNYSIGMPLNPRPAPGGALAFDFPVVGRGEIDAMTTGIEPLAGARRIVVRYRIDAEPGVRFMASETSEEAASVSLYFQQRGDNWTARGRYESYRWYAPKEAVIPLKRGIQTMTVPLDRSWVNVAFRPASQDPDGFAEALSDTARIGLAFGSPSLRSHGVYATGPARFTLISFDIE